MTISTLRLGIGLLILILVNIMLGSLSAVFIKNFNFRYFFRGFAKGSIVVGCFAATYLVGYLNPGIIAVSVNGLELDILTAIHLVVLAGYYHYAKQVIEKLATLINGKFDVHEKEINNIDKIDRIDDKTTLP